MSEPENPAENLKSNVPDPEIKPVNNISPEQDPDIESNNKIIEKEMNRRLFVSLLTGTAFSAAGFGTWKWIYYGDKADGIPWQLRKAHEFNEKLSRAYSKPERLAPTFPKEQAETPRANGDIGLNENFDPADWQLKAIGASGGTKTFSLNEIKSLPPVEIVTELKCIEGWSTIVQWKGARLFDFLMKYRLMSPASKYVGMSTPDEEYYVGLDIESAIHPQTLLAYEMNGTALTLDHGAPLRLVTPLKYGIKHIKRIGTINVLRNKPADYWAEQGYDWYSGH